MKSAHEHLAEMRQVALKLVNRIDRATEKVGRHVSIDDELTSIRQGASNLYLMEHEHRLLYGIGGPELRGIVNTSGIVKA